MKNKITKQQKELAKKAELKFKSIIEVCDGDYDQIIVALSEVYRKLTQPNPSKEDEETYKIKEIANSKTLKMKKCKAKYAFGFHRDFILCPEIYFYEKAPNGLIYALSIYDLEYDNKCPIRIDLFIEKENKL